jgi:hypothetical protein
MRTAPPRDPRDHDTLLPGAGTFAAALVLVLAALTAAFPQAAAAQAAVPCTAIADDSERLACYDRALRAAQPAPPTPAAPATEAPAAPAARTRASGEQAAPTPAPAAAAPAAAATSTATRQSPAAGPAADETISIVIVGVRALPGRETTFTAEDGASWVQTDSQRVVGLPDTPFEAELKAGAMGSKFLVPAGRSRAIRVRAREP